MGIPSYYKQIIQNYPNIIISQNNLKRNLDNLFFDLNCAIHPCCANKTNESDMYDAIYEKIKECIHITNVQKLIYIAIDGPAPRTKMEQQRQRRLKSLHENKIWDTNQITPGTNFMDQLSIFLNIKCKELKIPYIISDSNVPGEGEHKIMNYIDTLPDHEMNIVYGLDADLIMLSMIRKHTIYLLRERTEYNIENINTNYIYCNIQLLKDHVIDSIHSKNIQISKQSLLYDYLFLCFFIGNDFIIPTPCIHIRYNGIHTLLSIYNELQNDFNGLFFLLNDEKQIDFFNLKLFFQKISSKEKLLIQEILNIREKQENKFRRIFHKEIQSLKKETNISIIKNMTYHDLFTSEEKCKDFKNHLPILFRHHENLIFKNHNYHLKYYMSQFFNTLNYNPSYDDLLQINIKNICNEYLKSLQWTVNYYFNDCVSWRWYYKYHFAPLVIDLYNHIDDYHCNFKKDIPYTPKEQLKIVLPLQNDSYYYPNDTPIHSLLKRYLWECHSIMLH